MRRGRELGAAAANFIGVPFRLFGRDPEQGLDCIGLLVLSLQKVGCTPIEPVGYRLRNSDLGPWVGCAEGSGLVPVSGTINPGDVLLTSPGPGQYHLLIAQEAHWAIHAHAGLRRVVNQPLPDDLLLTRHWRLP